MELVFKWSCFFLVYT